MARAAFEEQIRLYVETSGDKEVGALYAQLKQLAEGADAGSEQAAVLVSELERLAAVSNGIRAFPALKQQVEATGKELGEAKVRAAELRAEFNAAESPTKRLTASMQRADAAVEKLTQTESRQRAELARTSKVLAEAGVDTERLGEAAQAVQWQFGQFGEKADDAARAAGRLGREGDGAARGVSAIDRAAKGASTSLSGIGARLTGVAAAATAAIGAMAAASSAALFTGAIRSAATLEDALTQVRAVTGATAEEMEALKAAAEAAGATTRFSTLEAAQGLGELARATGSAQSAIAALPATLSLAQAGGLAVADAATIMTTAMTSFGLAGDQASRVADVMAKEANSTTDSVSQLSNALSYAAPFASALNLEIEDVAAAIGVLADNGFRGERAGTALRFTFSQLADSGSEFAKAVRALGIETTDFGQILTELAARGELGRDAIAKLGTEAAPAIQRLAQTTPQLQALEATLRSAGGEAARTAVVMGQSVSSAAESISDSFDRTRRALVDPLLDPLQKELLTLSKELEAFAQSPEFGVIRESLVTLFQEGAAAARNLIESTDFQALAADIRAFATDSNGSLTSFKENLGLIVDAVQIIGDTASVVFNGVQAAVLGIAAVVSRAIGSIAESVETLSDPVVKILQFIGVLEEGPTALEEFVGGMNAVSEDFARRAIANFGEAADAVEAFGEDVGESSARLGASATEGARAAARLEGAAQQVGEASAAAASALDAQGAAAQGAAAQARTAAAQMDVDAQRLKKAFADLGIAAQSDLQRAAEAAKRNFELIRDAAGQGRATAEDARRAFAAYAEAARAASAESAPGVQAGVESQLALQAAVVGVTDKLTEQGAAGRAAGQQIAQGASAAAASFESAGAQAQSYASSVEWVSDGTADAGAKSKQASKDVQAFGLTVGSVSLEFTKAALAANKFVNSINNTTWRNTLNRLTAEYERQAKGLREQMEALDRELAKDDPMVKRVEELRAQYRYLGDDQLRALAEKEKQVADLQRQQEEAAASAAEAAREARRDAAATDPAAAASITRRAGEAADATSQVLDQAERAAAALGSAASQISRAPAGEVVLRVVYEGAAPGGGQLQLKTTDIRALTAAVVAELRRQQGLTR